MIKVLVWQVSNDSRFLNGALNILERQHNGLELVGVTANEETSLVYKGKNVTFIPLAEVNGGVDYDLILVVGAKSIGMSQVTKDAARLNLPEEKLLGDWIVRIPGFTLEKYRHLQRSRLSILSVNCIGGLLSHKMGLPFRSPFVNLFLSNGDFLKFLGKPHEYLAEKLIHKGQKLNSTSTIEYPVISLGDISLHMLHYKTFEEVAEAWERRKERINWYNLFVVMWTTKIEELEQFDALPYGKKVCFVPFKSDLDSAWYIEHRLKRRYPLYMHFINETAKGNPFFYDPFRYAPLRQENSAT